MTGLFRAVATAVGFAGLCCAQQFEVASIKQSGTPSQPAYAIDSSRVELGAFPLSSLILMAYRLDPYQLDGPEWMRATRFDLLAKMPAGATKEQVPEMLREVLADRFKLAVHHESREQQVYALVPGKDGPKLKEGAADNSDRSFLNGRVSLYRIDTKEGDGIWSISSLDGRRVFDAQRISMQELAQTVAAWVEDPVVDMTGLKGFWQVRMEVPLNLRETANRAALTMQSRGGPALDPEGVSIFTALRKLGLELEHRKAPVDHLVIDSVEKTPTEN